MSQNFILIFMPIYTIFFNFWLYSRIKEIFKFNLNFAIKSLFQIKNSNCNKIVKNF